MLYERSQLETQKEEDELKKRALRRYKINAIIINVVFACAFIAVAVMAFFEETSLFAFILCCFFSCLWSNSFGAFQASARRDACAVHRRHVVKRRVSLGNRRKVRVRLRRRVGARFLFFVNNRTNQLIFLHKSSIIN